MEQLLFFPSLIGFIAGVAVLPTVASMIHLYQRNKRLREEQERLKNTTFLLSGSLEKNQLTTHIESLCKLGRQGVLHILTGRRKGYVLFRDGFILDGFYRNNYGMNGMNEILNLTEGEYYFESRAVLQPNLIREPLQNIVKIEKSTSK